jgi:hypothetical protein
MKTFHVLVLDDNRELIEKLGSRMTHIHHIARTEWKVELHEIHVEVVLQNGKPFFSQETLQSIVDACRENPNLILLDYGFISSEHTNLAPDEYFKNILTPADLIPALREYLQRTAPHDRKLAALITSALTANTCPTYLYTFTGRDFQRKSPIPDERKRLTQRAFPNTEIQLLDISQEIFANDAFSGEDKNFRAFLTAGLLARIIERELLLKILASENERLRFVRYYRSGIGVVVIILLGGAIGAVGSWLGGLIVTLIMENNTTMALTLGICSVVVSFLLGLVVPIFFERLMSNLLIKLKSDDANLRE